jgi:hypothetical protein
MPKIRENTENQQPHPSRVDALAPVGIVLCADPLPCADPGPFPAIFNFPRLIRLYID